MTDEQPATRRTKIGVQILLYKTPLDAVERTVKSLDNSSRVGLMDGLADGLVVAIGDASPMPTLTEEQVADLSARSPHLQRISYRFFDKNLGFSKGHNRISRGLKNCDFIVLANPDVVVEPRAIWHLLQTFDDPRIGLAEAKQLPVEHPKDYDLETGATDWSSAAFAMVRRSLWDQLGGMDGDTFFMYCEDVDFSWRVREAGYFNVIQPAAVVFHDKRLSGKGRWVPTDTEIRYSAASRLFLAHKWSRPGIVADLLAEYDRSDSAPLRAAAQAYRRRLRNGRLPAPRDPDHQVGVFRKSTYAKHRFAL